ncbi:MAG: InlB B-repeat-containing protein [Brotaphodocola sp.]
MGREGVKRSRRRSKASQLVRFLRREGKRYCAAALCVSLIAGHIGNLAAVADDGSSADYEFELDRLDLYEALQEAVAEDQTVENDFQFDGQAAESYESLMEADGTLYELKPEIPDNKGKVSLRVFARLDGEIELDSAYEVDGSEEMIFLLTNTSNEEKTAVIRVGDKTTEEIKVAPKTAVMSDSQMDAYKSASELGGPGANGETQAADGIVISGGSSGSGSGGGGGSSSGGSSHGGASVEVIDEAEQESEAEAGVSEETEADTSDNQDKGDSVKEETDDQNGQDDDGSSKDSSDADITIDTGSDKGSSDAGSEVSKGSDVSVDEPEDTDDSSSDKADSEDHGTKEQDSKEQDAKGEDSKEAGSDGDSSEKQEADEKTAAISLHKAWLVAATPSDAEKADEEEATPSDATGSDADLEVLDGTLYDAVLTDKGSAVAFAATFEELELDVDLSELGAESNTICVYEADEKDVSVEVRALRGTFPADAVLKVTMFSESDEEYTAAKETLEQENPSFDGMLAMDISFYDADGNEIEPDDERNVWVSIHLKNDVLPENINQGTLTVQHLKENVNGDIELEHVADTVDETDGVIEFESEVTIAEFHLKSFSTVTVKWQTTTLATPYESRQVIFDIGEDATAAGVEAPDPVMTGENGCVEYLPTPVWNDKNGDPVMAFGGWYLDEQFETEFDTNTPLEDDTTVYANWVSLEEDGYYYVNYCTFDGNTVLLTIAVKEGKTVSSIDAVPVEGKIFKGWSTSLQGDSPVEDFDSFDFNNPVSSSIADDGNTLNLYAWYGDAVKVSFISNGGIAVPTQYIEKGQTVQSVIPVREGYTFVGWSTNKDKYEAFNFSSTVEEDLTLYAFWEANFVPFTVVYMFENADDSEYTPAGYSTTFYAPSGSYVSVVQNNVTNNNTYHNLRYSVTLDGEPEQDVRISEAGGTAQIKDIPNTIASDIASYVQYYSATNRRQIMPDGSTVMLVYYNRARVTLTFNFTTGTANNDSNYPYCEDSSNAGSINIDEKISKQDQDKYNVVYTPYDGDNKKFEYSFTAKYGQDITPVWPQITWVNHSSVGTSREFFAWRCPDNTIQASRMFTLESYLFNKLSITNGVLQGTGSLSAYANENVKVDWLIYARTTLPDEEPDFTYNNKNYTIYKEACQKGLSPSQTGIFEYKALAGCVAVEYPPKSNSTKIAWYAKYRNLNELSEFKFDYSYGWFKNDSVSVKVYDSSKTMKDIFDGVFVGTDTYANTNDNCQILLYDRNTLKLTLYTKDETYGESKSDDQYLYGDYIYNDDNDLLKTVELGMKKDGYTFAGWYTDPSFTDGTQFVPNANSRIYANMDLYAKWDPSQFKAEFYLYTDDMTPYREQGFVEGGKLTNWIVPSEVQDSFIGWYWYQDGVLQPFDFTSPVGCNHVGEDGILKLYGVWSGENGTVVYLPGIGGDNDSQRKEDPTKYRINDASVLLSKPSVLWNGAVPENTALTFIGWKAPNGAVYQPGRYVLVTRQLMEFEAQWTTDAVQLIYDANGGDGERVTETWGRNQTVDVWDNMDANTPHFTREGYELIGWDTVSTAETPTYQLGSGTILLSEDEKTLYAIWKPATVDVVIKKTVSGRMGDTAKKFKFTVRSNKAMSEIKSSYDKSGCKFEDADKTIATFYIGHNDTATLVGVPIGAALTIEEESGKYEMTVESDSSSVNINEVSKTSTTSTCTCTIANTATGEIDITVNNEYDPKDIDTGVILDSIPYILILLAVAAGVAFFVIRKRKSDEDNLD